MKLETGNWKLESTVAMALAIGLCAGLACATDFVWTDGAANGDWTSAGNWNIGSGYPDGADDTATVTNSSWLITVPAGLTVGEILVGGTYSGTNTLAGSLTASTASGKSGNLTLNAGMLQTAKDTNGDITVGGTLLVGTNGTLVVRRSSTTGNGAGRAIGANAMTIHGTMHADYEGFAGNSGPGKGTGDGNGGAGGAHGGRGGYGTGGVCVPGSPYGSPTNAVSLGSGGGGGSGGAGGGAIQLNVAGTFTVNGRLSADGGNAGSLNGGGAGGTLRITTGLLAGKGTIQANGGVGGLYSGSYCGGGGGGGRIDLSQVSTNVFEGAVSVAGGAKGGDTVNMTAGSSRGSAGTINWPPNCSLTLGTGAGQMTNVVMGTDGTFRYDFGSGAMTINNGGRLTVDGDPSLNSGNGGGVTITVASVTINAGGILSADEMGFDSTFGPGASGTANRPSGGAGYGGTGGASSAGAAGGSTYGSSNSPVALGSGSGHNTDWTRRGAKGGGVVCLKVSGTVTINGTISANGGVASDPTAGRGTGGGSGGSVDITAKLHTGTTGVISLNGGAGLGGGGGGGGGRIRIAGYDWSSQTRLFGGAITVAGGSGTASGSPGTIFYYMPPPPRGTVVYFK